MKKNGDDNLVTVGLLRSTLAEAFSDFGRQFGREMRDFVRQEISASEVRIKKEVISEVLEGVAEIIDHSIHPQLDNHEQRILKLEAKA